MMYLVAVVEACQGFERSIKSCKRFVTLAPLHPRPRYNLINSILDSFLILLKQRPSVAYQTY